MKKPMRLPVTPLLLFFAVSVVGTLGVLSFAAFPSKVYAQAVAQSFTADTEVRAGMAVELAGDKSKVKPVTQSDASKMIGVIVQSNDAPISLTSTTAGSQVYVATTGTYRVLVSDQNGAIKKGDYLVVSSFDGVAMKVDDTSTYVVGKALADFDGSGSVLSQTTVQDTAGKSHKISLGYLSTTINISRNPLLHSNASTSNVPGFLLRATESISNKPVSPIKAYISLAIAVFTSVIACVMLYAAIRSSLISMGRNPLARKSIMRNLIQVVVTSVIILITGFFAVYLLLKL
jgi:hypothetical protein